MLRLCGFVLSKSFPRVASRLAAKMSIICTKQGRWTRYAIIITVRKPGPAARSYCTSMAHGLGLLWLMNFDRREMNVLLLKSMVVALLQA